MATARRPEQLDALASGWGEQARICPLDVTDQAAVEGAVKATLEEFGRVDVVVNNAGHGSVGAVEELTMAGLRALMEVMFFGAVAVTKAVVPYLRAQGSGVIVQMSSMGGQLSMAGFGAYCAAKFPLEGLSEALAAEVALGIRPRPRLPSCAHSTAKTRRCGWLSAPTRSRRSAPTRLGSARTSNPGSRSARPRRSRRGRAAAPDPSPERPRYAGGARRSPRRRGPRRWRRGTRFSRRRVPPGTR
jgi:NAD(P)-dependent dehydrogenase (short-subunit alcohol dehydrogenase family)